MQIDEQPGVTPRKGGGEVEQALRAARRKKTPHQEKPGTWGALIELL